MTDPAPTPAPTWPLAAGEHPTLPELVLELHEGHPATTVRRKATPGIPPYVRALISPLRVLQTSNPDRLRAWARQLDATADALEQEHQVFTAATGQLPLHGKA